MAYEIKTGEYQAEPMRETRGRKAHYPLREMHVGQWLRFPYEEQWRFARAARWARKNGVRVQVLKDQEGDGFIAVRIA